MNKPTRSAKSSQWGMTVMAVAHCGHNKPKYWHFSEDNIYVKSERIYYVYIVHIIQVIYGIDWNTNNSIKNYIGLCPHWVNNVIYTWHGVFSGKKVKAKSQKMLCTMSHGDDFGTCSVYEKNSQFPNHQVRIVNDIFVETLPIIIIICFRIKELEPEHWIVRSGWYSSKARPYLVGAPQRDASTLATNMSAEARFHLSYDFNQNRKTHIFNTHTHMNQ